MTHFIREIISKVEELIQLTFPKTVDYFMILKLPAMILWSNRNQENIYIFFQTDAIDWFLNTQFAIIFPKKGTFLRYTVSF